MLQHPVKDVLSVFKASSVHNYYQGSTRQANSTINSSERYIALNSSNAASVKFYSSLLKKEFQAFTSIRPNENYFLVSLLFTCLQNVEEAT